MRSRLFDWALLLVLALTIVGSFTAPRQPGRDLLHLSISDLQVTPIAPGDAEPQRAHLTVNWRWDGAPRAELGEGVQRHAPRPAVGSRGNKEGDSPHSAAAFPLLGALSLLPLPPLPLLQDLDGLYAPHVDD
jgi:hypothetical protein